MRLREEQDVESQRVRAAYAEVERMKRNVEAATMARLEVAALSCAVLRSAQGPRLAFGGCKHAFDSDKRGRADGEAASRNAVANRKR